MSLYTGVFVVLLLLIIGLITQKYMLFVFLVFMFMVLDMVLGGENHWQIHVMSNFFMLLLIIKDTLRNKDNSLILKYNPLYERNKLNPKVRFVLLVIILISFFIHFFSKFLR